MTKLTREPLPKTMQAVVCHGPEDYRLEELPVPQAGPGEVVIKVLSAGICASDVKCYSGAPLFWGDEHRPAYCQAPVVPGHEFVGVVVSMERGENAAMGSPKLSIGDLVVSEQIVPCWKCRYCRRGQYWMCQVNDIYGFRQRTSGAMAEYMKLPAGALNHKVPAAIDPNHAVLAEPLACSIHAVQRGDIEFGDVVVVAGCGPLGLGMVAAARMKSPGCLVALDLNDMRLQIARKCGADLLLNPSQQDVVAEILSITDGYGCDVYIEATGHPSGVAYGLHMIRKLGTFVQFSVMRELVSVDWTIIGDTKELNLHGSHLGPYCYPIALDMLATKELPVDDIITHVLPLSEYERGLQLVASGKDSIKVVLRP